jgi:hypothetical protein
MGLMCSWIAVKGVSKDALLQAVGMVETDKDWQVEPACREVNFSYKERADGWTVIVAEDFDWASRERIIELSRLGPTVGCQFEDKVEMTSIATGAQDGAELWRVFHVCEEKRSDRLDVSGDPPPQFAESRDRLFREQEEDEGVDFIHDIPLEVAKAACGYRLDDELEPFRALKPVGAEDDAAHYGDLHRSVYGARPSGPGLLSSLFGIFRRK